MRLPTSSLHLRTLDNPFIWDMHVLPCLIGTDSGKASHLAKHSDILQTVLKQLIVLALLTSPLASDVQPQPQSRMRHVSCTGNLIVLTIILERCTDSSDLEECSMHRTYRRHLTRVPESHYKNQR